MAEETNVDSGWEGYEPEAIEDGFGEKVFLKGDFTCIVNEAMVEAYDGGFEDYQGDDKFGYELEIVASKGNKSIGMRFWKNYYYAKGAEETTDKNGKTKFKKSHKHQMADLFFTLFGEEGRITKDRGVDEVIELFASKTYKVNAYHFEGSDGKVQMHSIKGIVEDERSDEGPGGF